MTYPNLTDEDIQKLRDAISNALGNMKSDIRKDKLKVFGKTLLSLIIVAGGVAVSVIFPNPITIGVLGGAATLIAGNKGIFGKAKKIKEKSRLRKRDKEEVKNMAVEQGKREVANEVYSRFYQQELRNNHVPEPSAPPPYYPDLKQFQKL